MSCTLLVPSLFLQLRRPPRSTPLSLTTLFRSVFDKVARNDGTVQSNQALLPFLGVLAAACAGAAAGALLVRLAFAVRSEEHTSELQSQSNLVCRLLLEKKNAWQRHWISCA